MLFGMVAGLGLAAAAWWLLAPPAGRPAVAAKAVTAETTPPEPTPRTAEPVEIEPSGRGFDFYEMLPEQEVVVSDDFRERRERRTAPPTVSEPGRYIIQAGSFRNADGAEETKARLGMQGIRANVLVVRTEAGTLHQVRVGPIDVATLNEYRRRLAAADIAVIVLRLDD